MAFREFTEYLSKDAYELLFESLRKLSKGVEESLFESLRKNSQKV